MHWERLPTIDASRVSLRWISAKDTDAFFAIYSNPEVMRYWSTPPLADREAAANLIKKIHEDWKRHLILKWGIALRTDDRLIGSITLFNLDFNHRRSEIGYALGREYWGQGYMNEALTAVLNYAFKVLDLHRIEADVDPRIRAGLQLGRGLAGIFPVPAALAGNIAATDSNQSDGGSHPQAVQSMDRGPRRQGLELTPLTLAPTRCRSHGGPALVEAATLGQLDRC